MLTRREKLIFIDTTRRVFIDTRLIFPDFKQINKQEQPI